MMELLVQTAQCCCDLGDVDKVKQHSVCDLRRYTETLMDTTGFSEVRWAF